MAMIAVFLNRMLTVFLALVMPLSRAAKPRCMMNTRKVATSIQVLFTVNISAETSPCANAALGASTSPSSNSA